MVNTGKRKDIKGHILKVADELFEKYGYDNTSMENIAKMSGTSRRTLFRLFESKSEILYLSNDDILKKILEQKIGENYSLRDIVDAVIKALDNATDEEKINMMYSIQKLRDEPDFQSKVFYKLIKVIQIIPTDEDDNGWILKGAFIGVVISGWARNIEEPNMNALDDIRNQIVEFKRNFL